MKTVLVYDHFIARGGAENVSFQIANQLNNCIVETAFADESIFEKEQKQGRLINHGYHYLNTLFPTFFLAFFYLFRFKVSKDSHNLILSGVFSPLSLFKGRTNGKSIVYFHTFPSFVDLSFNTLIKIHGLAGAVFFNLFTPCYVYLLIKSINNADVVFSNSKIVQKRFKARGIITDVLYPPIDLKGLSNESKTGYFLSTARLEENKRIEQVLEVFSKLPHVMLNVVGGGSLFKPLQLKYKNHQNIKFLGWLSITDTKIQYNYCNALICIPVNEYFGIAPVEAMAAGKPIIGVAEGGLLETVTDDRLGILLKSPIDISLLKTTVEHVYQTNCNCDDIKFRQQHARKFDESNFMRKLKLHLN